MLVDSIRFDQTHTNDLSFTGSAANLCLQQFFFIADHQRRRSITIA
jgi:hypothetical protein